MQHSAILELTGTILHLDLVEKELKYNRLMKVETTMHQMVHLYR
jgi:hypothetical protein